MAVGLTPAAAEVLRRGYLDARERRHEYVTVEHLLGALCLDERAGAILAGCGADVHALLADAQAGLASMERRPFWRREPEETPAWMRVLDRAAITVEAAGLQLVDTSDLLAAIYREGVSRAVDVLLAHGVTRLAVLEVAAHGERASDRPAAPPGARRCRVLLHNDSYTTMEFVVAILRTIFDFDEAAATSLMMDVHTKGLGLVGRFDSDAAVGKVEKVRAMARDAGFPLKCTLLPE